MKKGDPCCLQPKMDEIIIANNNIKYCNNCFKNEFDNNIKCKFKINSHITTLCDPTFITCNTCDKKLWKIRKFINCSTYFHGKIDTEIFSPIFCSS